MRLNFEHDGEPITIVCERRDESWLVRLPDGAERLISTRRLDDDIIEITTSERVFRAAFSQRNGVVDLSCSGRVYSFRPAGAVSLKATDQRSSGQITAHMAGVVSSVLVQSGQRVEVYQPLLVLEAMKVLATLEAPFAGTAMVYVNKGQQVEHGALLAEVVPDDEAKNVDRT